MSLVSHTFDCSKRVYVMLYRTKIIMAFISYDQYQVMCSVNWSYALYPGFKTLHGVNVRVCTLTETVQYIPSVLLMRHSQSLVSVSLGCGSSVEEIMMFMASLFPGGCWGKGWGCRKSIQWSLIGEPGE